MAFRKYLLLLISMFAGTCVCNINAQTDVTKYYILNSDFSTGSTNGWTISMSASNQGYQSATYTNGDVSISGFIECWVPSNNNLGNGEIYYTIRNLPAGDYRLSCDAIATKQGKNTMNGVSLFAGNDYSLEMQTQNERPQHFVLNFTNESNGDINIGIRTQNASCNWIAADNWMLESFAEYSDELNPDNCVLTEIMPLNVDLFIDPSWNYGGYIELYNPSHSNALLEGAYISDDAQNLRKWSVHSSVGFLPAGGYKTIWFDHNDQYAPMQVPFELNLTDGGTIYLSDKNGLLVASQTYPPAMRRCSYSRNSSGEWGWTATPTPGADNGNVAFATTQLEKPVPSVNGKIFTANFSVNVPIPAGYTLRYTKDGSTPTMTNGFNSYTGNFSITASSIYRWRFFRNGYLPSDVTTCSYIKKEYDYNVPIISVVTDSKNLTGADYGIMVKGNGNGRSGRGQNTPCNWNMDWDRPVSMEYFENGEEVSFAQEVNMSAVGGWSRAWEPHSFKLKANKLYGINYLPYPVFENKPYNKNKTLQIRNGGNDTSCRFIDPAIQTIVASSGIDIDCQSYKPVFIYLNGQFYAVENMREPNNKHFAYANRGLDDEEIDQFEYSPDSAYVQVEGTKEKFDELIALSYNASNPVVYNQIRALLDIDEFINYFAVEMYLDCGDWLGNSNNVKAYRPIREDGKFRFVLFDTDSYNSNGFKDIKTPMTLDYLYDQGTSLTKDIELATLWFNLLENAEFRKQFIDAFCLVTGSVFEPERCQEIIEQLHQRAYDAMSQTGANPNSSANGLKNYFTASRQSNRISYMQGYSRLQASSLSSFVSRLSSNINEARIKVNNQIVPTNTFSGTLFLPVTLKAEAPAGYQFLGWKDLGGGSTTIKKTVFAKSSSWKYYDKGSLDNTGWNTTSYADASWQSGNAPFGYDTNNSKQFNTTLDYYISSNNYRPTYYFRKEVNITDNPSSATFTLNYTVDDGFVIRVNGQIAGRYLMNSDEPRYSDFASTWAHDNPDSGTMTLDNGLFHVGENLITVEIHNNSATSSDIYWDAELIMDVPNEGGDYISTDAEFIIPSASNYDLVATFAPVESDDDYPVAPISINEVSAGNSVNVNTDYFKKDDWIELYNTTDHDIDIAGMYLSDNLSQPQKFQIPDAEGLNTVIPSHGHLAVWASKRAIIADQIHTNFKLGNADGELVLLTSEDGDWTDTLRYVLHGDKESVGRYPDGGADVYRMINPSLVRTNRTDSYSTYLYTYHYNPGGDDTSFRLELTEGWNWISHPLERNINVSEIGQYFTQIKGQKTIPSSLSPTAMYKVQMMQDADYDFDEPLFADGNTIVMSTGWNWIGYPKNHQMTLSGALLRFSASESDVIMGQGGFATYENGTWGGSLTHLEPGQGYMYRSVAPRTLIYADEDATAQIKPRFHHQARSPWTASAMDYPSVMGMVAKLSNTLGSQLSALSFSIGVFDADGTCRGTSKEIDGKFFITVYGTGDEPLILRAVDSDTGIIYDINEQFRFTSDVLGRMNAPVHLTIGEPTDIANTRTSEAFDRVEYYLLNGQKISGLWALDSGLYIAKYILKDGTTITKKIYKK